MESLLTTKQLAEFLDVSPRQIAYLRSNEALPWLAIGGLVRFRLSEIETWLNTRVRTDGPQSLKEDSEVSHV